MTLPIERARSRKPITWLTILGILLLPAAVGGILVAALQNPTERLDSMTAAIVNLDDPVTIDGQLTPLGRQLSAGLVEGSDDLDSNLTWVISNKDDAAEGLADGTYQAVITIPEDFSAAATSAGQAISDGGGAASDKAEKATITVTTPPDGLVADDLITSQIASVATSTMGSMLSEATMSNVLVGFTTLGDQIGEAADGALQLASGARDAATGAAAIPDGAAKLATGASGLGSGASDLANGLGTIAGSTRQIAAGAGQLGSGLLGGASGLQQTGLVPAKLSDGAAAVQQLTSGVAAGVSGLSTELTKLVGECDTVATPDFCAKLKNASATAAGLVDPEKGPAILAAGAATGTAAGLKAFNTEATATLSAQMRDAGTAASSISAGLNQLATDGIDKSASGARQLADGATQLSDGATQLSTGATELATGLDTLATGTGDLAGGLRKASDSLPSFTDGESKSLATVMADPVTSNSKMDTIFGPTAIPLLAAVVLWFGGLASFIVMRAHTARTLTSRRSSAGLALRSFAPAALIGAGQGVLVALIVQIVASYDAATWWAFAGTAVLAGVVFAAVNQALVAVFGGIGRWIGALVGVLAVATGLISTVPGWLSAIGASLPTAPAFTGLIAANGGAAAGLVVWGVLSLIVTTLAIALRRTTSAKTVLATA
ncbi:YhgE/Pip domain-containing protein [Microbacterium sp. OVT16B]|uniref:YhgE/Pip domain-containing protein n=1 Tax=Microbacterium sp. OVT16B TaxID=2862682 RepID=UPI001CC18C2C|nr:YhgE/Pip family protein [Microbacterium sp. OVT16B]